SSPVCSFSRLSPPPTSTLFPYTTLFRSALMFREIHRSIGHLDQLLRRRAVKRITRDAEAGTDVFLTQQWIGGNPVDPLLREKNIDRKSTRLNSSHVEISYAVFCLKKKKK